MEIKPEIKVDAKTGKPTYVGFRGRMTFAELAKGQQWIGEKLGAIGVIRRRKLRPRHKR